MGSLYVASGDREANPRLPWSGKEKWFVLVASLLFLLLAIGSIQRESVTSNEVLFIPAGLSYLERHDGRMDIEEPPLVKILAAIPAWLVHAKADYSDATWTENPGSYDPEYSFGAKFFETWNRDHRGMLFLARLPTVGLTLLLGLSLYKMAREIAGPWGGAVTLTLFVTSPFFLAYGPIVLMDVPVAFFSIWTMWFFASLWQEPSKRNALGFAGSLTGALVTKFSGVFLFPAIILAWCLFWYLERRSLDQARRPSTMERPFYRERLALGAMVLAGVVVYFFYLGTFYRSDPRVILANEMDSMAKDFLRTLPIDILVRRMNNHPGLEPLLLSPALYAGGLAYVLGRGSRPMYFLGRTFPHGVWFYFPIISLLKLAPGMILVILLVVVLAIKSLLGKRTQELAIIPDSVRFHCAAVAAALVVFAAIAMASKLNVGVRHFSVPITCITLLSSLVIPMTRSVLRPRVQPFLFATIAALLMSSLLTALLTYPDYMSYFNVFRLGMAKQDIAQNSNLNWGQSMEEVATFFRKHGVSDPYVENAASIDPSVYVPGAHAWDCEKPGLADPEWVAVSTYKLIEGMPKCLELERYPSWVIGGGTVVIFHLTNPRPADSRPQ